ncbi:MAG: PD-(D/E)XK nuclease-like domain-containing protein [Betaproteobacteria bacterium]|nr:MAG: PD-(D/E)XK nuclease-like domain-containing protein [Betaproteobacteria bacterium]
MTGENNASRTNAPGTNEPGANEPMSKQCEAGFCESRREPLADYLANRDFVSSTQLRRFDKSGLTASQLADGGLVTGTVMGEALHALVLEPEVFSQQYLVLADADHDRRAPSEAELMRRIWLDAWQWSALSYARDALLACSQAPVADWLSAGNKELSIYWIDEVGARWKARPDCFTRGIVLDLKTTSDCRPDAFKRTREHFGYDLQAAHYVEAVTRLTGSTPQFAFLSVELSAPYSVWVHELEAGEIRAARLLLDQLKHAYIAASKTAGDAAGSA